MTDKSKSVPEWVKTERDFIAKLRGDADAAISDSDKAESPTTRSRLASEASISLEYADAAEKLLDARIAFENGSGSQAARDAAEAAVYNLRNSWREIDALRRSGYLHEFAALAAENKD